MALDLLPTPSPALTRLHITRTLEASSEPDLTALKELPALQRLRLQPGSDRVHGLHRLPPHIQITTM